MLSCAGMRQFTLSPRTQACLDAEARGVSPDVLERVRALNVFVDDVDPSVWAEVISALERMPPRGAWGFVLMCHGFSEQAA